MKEKPVGKTLNRPDTDIGEKPTLLPKTSNPKVLAIWKALYQKVAITTEPDGNKKYFITDPLLTYPVIQKSTPEAYGFTCLRDVERVIAKAFFTLDNIHEHYTLARSAVEETICSLFSLYQTLLVEEFALFGVKDANSSVNALTNALEEEILDDSEDRTDEEIKSKTLQM